MTIPLPVNLERAFSDINMNNGFYSQLSPSINIYSHCNPIRFSCDIFDNFPLELPKEGGGI